MAELMKHRAADSSKRYRILSEKFIKKYGSEKSFQCLREEKNSLLKVDFTEFNKRYTERDRSARMRMKELINSDKNRVEKVFSSMI